MNILEIEGLGLECQVAGRIWPWIGPAFRGMVAKTFKDSICRHSVPERESRWIACRGCPHMADCPYGQTLEPDPPSGAAVRRGQADAARPLVLAPAFPLPEEVRAGTVIPLRLVLIGVAAERANQLLEMIDLAGRTKGLHPCFQGPQRGGHGAKRIPLRLGRTTALTQRSYRLTAGDFAADSADCVPEVRVALTSPLAISVQNEISLAPRFGDLLAASLRVVSHLFSLYDQPLEVDFEHLKQLAECVTPVASGFRPYSQPITSNRARQKHEFRGVVGTSVYRDVPRALLPWLEWGGRLHVGERRIAGAGGWRVS